MQQRQYPQFLMIGDSHIQFTNRLQDGFAFVAGLGNHIERRLDLINRGFSGYNSSHLLNVMEEIIPSTSSGKVDYVLVLLGSNDSCLPGSPTQQHLPLSEYRRNVEAIVSHALIQAHKPHKIFLVTPPPINEVQLEEVLVEGQTLSRHQSFTSSYAQAVREVAEQTKNQHVVLIDLWSAMMREATSSTPDYVEGDVLPGSKAAGENKSLRNLLSDGLHMTGAGYKLFLNEVLKAMGGSWLDESFHHKELWVFPRWEEAPKLQ